MTEDSENLRKRKPNNPVAYRPDVAAWKLKDLHPVTIREEAEGYRCYVYFIQCPVTKRVKIGFSGDPEDRLRGMKSFCPTEIFMLYKIKTLSGLEPMLHERFAKYRAHHEWFEYGEELRVFIEALRAEERGNDG